jgi:hypothetical protein
MKKTLVRAIVLASSLTSLLLVGGLGYTRRR